MAKKKTAEAATAEEKLPPSLEQLVLDRKEGKYRIVELAAFWTKQLRLKEEHRHLTQTEVLELALYQVLSGEVTEKEVEKLKRAAPVPAPASEDGTEKSRGKKLSL